MATKNICTYPLLPNMGIRTNAIVEQDGKLQRVNLDHEFEKRAKSIFCEAAGEIVLLKDAADARAKNIILFGKTKQKSYDGKNLLQVTGGSDVISGVTFTANEDGSITVDGTATDSINYILSKAGVSVIENNTEYLLSGCPLGGGSGIYELRISDLVTKAHVHYGGEAIKFSYEDASELTAYIRISAGVTISNLTFYPMISKEGGEYEVYTGGKAAPNPGYPQEIVSVKNPTVKVLGKNILQPKPNKVSGYTAVVNEDGSVTVTGAANTTNAIYLTIATPSAENPLKLKKDEKYFMWGESTNGKYIGTKTVDDKGNPAWSTVSTWNKHVGTDYMNIAQLYLESNGHEVGDTSLCGTYRFQLEVGDAFTGFEGYKEEQTLVITTPDGVPGIPVADGGNYKDKDDQSWICDEIDLERGVYVQRIGKKVLDASSDEYWYTINATGGVIFAHAISDAKAEGSSKKCFCSHFKASVSDAYNKTADACYFYDKTFRVCHMSIGTLDAFKTWLNENPITVYYVLETPVETELADSLIYAFKDIYTNYPNTTILNDADAYMNVEYVADTKTFIVNSIYESMATITPVFSLDIELPVSGWRLSNDNTYFYQIIEIEGTTKKSKIDLQPTSAQLISFINNGTSMFASNENGTIYVYAIGAKPNADITIQATKTEVVYV